jgi:hypothetical protein
MGGAISQLVSARGGAVGASISPNSAPLFQVDTSPLSLRNAEKNINIGKHSEWLALIEKKDDDDGT